ncbi:LuxR C-terminal-related transcriptional regulator [Chryseobacterium sp. MYb328]|uniref:LuxR C-terminal-related transcriptional regulator n=1 Tax=Chryseobacterium sp. MYb328 TaxID=2745231 RepID=UPI0030B2E937
MDKLNTITSNKFLKLKTNSTENIDYLGLYSNTIENIRRFAISPFFWIIISNREQKTQLVSDNIGDFTPFPKSDWISSEFDFFINLFHPEDRSFLLAAFEFAVDKYFGIDEDTRNATTVNIYGRMLNKDNDYRWILLQSPQLCINQYDQIDSTLNVIFDLHNFKFEQLPLISIITPDIKETQYYKGKNNSIEKNEMELEVPYITKREKEILRLISQGFTTPEIAKKLFISYSTVENHKSNLRKKTGTKTSSALIAFVIRYNLLLI